MKQTVLLMTDTQGADMVGCYGATPAKTPSIDKLAAEGARFERAYTCQPVCGPARSAIFTGTYPHTNGFWANSMPIGDTIKTIGQRLTDKGIHCAYIGKGVSPYIGSSFWFCVLQHPPDPGSASRPARH